MNDIPKTDFQIRVELGREAKDLMENRAFSTAIAVLHKQWVNELTNDATDSSKVQELVAKLKALEAIPALLNSLMATTAHANRWGANVRHPG